MLLKKVAMAIVRANCWKSCPAMPGMNAVGTNTASRTRVVAITGPLTSFIEMMAASLGVHPSSSR